MTTITEMVIREQIMEVEMEFLRDGSWARLTMRLRELGVAEEIRMRVHSRLLNMRKYGRTHDDA